MDLCWQSNVSAFQNMLSTLVITFIPRSKLLLFSWLQSPSAVILEPQKIRSATVSTVSPSISHEVYGTGCHDLHFHSPLSFHQETFQFLFTFCHKGGVICIYEAIDISPGNLLSILCFFQSRVSHDVLCIEVKSAGWEHTALTYSFS